jgi:hypothetical protein
MKAFQEMRQQVRDELEDEIDDDDDDPRQPAAPAAAAPPAAAATEPEPESQEAGPELEAVLIALDALEVPPVWKKIAKAVLPALLRKPDRKDLAVQYLAAYANGQIPVALLAQTIRTEAAAKYSRQLAKLVDEHPAVVARLVGLIDEQLGAFYATEAGQTKIRELQAAMKGGGS